MVWKMRYKYLLVVIVGILLTSNILPLYFSSWYFGTSKSGTSTKYRPPSVSALQTTTTTCSVMIWDLSGYLKTGVAVSGGVAACIGDLWFVQVDRPVVTMNVELNRTGTYASEIRVNGPSNVSWTESSLDDVNHTINNPPQGEWWIYINPPIQSGGSAGYSLMITLVNETVSTPTTSPSTTSSSSNTTSSSDGTTFNLLDYSVLIIIGVSILVIVTVAGAMRKRRE